MTIVVYELSFRTRSAMAVVGEIQDVNESLVPLKISGRRHR